MITIIVQARMGSTRLPGKVLKPISGRPMLSYQIERLRRSRRIDQIVIATSVDSADDAIAAFCDAESLQCVRGSQQDVLSRFGLAARASRATVVVRITGDCPLVDPGLIDMAIAAYVDEGGCDYVSNMLEPTWPFGMAVEVFGSDALFEAEVRARDPREREHVTPYIYWRPAEFRLKSLTHNPNLSHHRWTVDTPEDFELISRIIGTLYPMQPDFTMNDVLNILAANPGWSEINKHIRQVSINRG